MLLPTSVQLHGVVKLMVPFVPGLRFFGENSMSLAPLLSPTLMPQFPASLTTVTLVDIALIAIDLLVWLSASNEPLRL
ncbi:MAG: hypothetical protein E6I72_10485 [Chloroflexi bacterium]|nr:MAG: hypothetical protein E6I72_10485 [Chloroflexota bacterium]